jgi:hypothetical protein
MNGHLESIADNVAPPKCQKKSTNKSIVSKELLNPQFIEDNVLDALPFINPLMDPIFLVNFSAVQDNVLDALPFIIIDI